MVAAAGGGGDMICVVVVEAHPLFRERLSGLRATVSAIEVVAAVGDRDEAVRRCLELRPDVVLMDLNLPGTPSLM